MNGFSVYTLGTMYGIHVRTMQQNELLKTCAGYRYVDGKTMPEWMGKQVSVFEDDAIGNP